MLEGGKYVNTGIQLCYLHMFLLVAVGTEAMYFLHKVGRRMQYVSHEKRSFSFLIQRRSVAGLQRGNAAFIIGTVPHSASWVPGMNCSIFNLF